MAFETQFQPHIQYDILVAHIRAQTHLIDAEIMRLGHRPSRAAQVQSLRDKAEALHFVLTCVFRIDRNREPLRLRLRNYAARKTIATPPAFVMRGPDRRGQPIAAPVKRGPGRPRKVDTTPAAPAKRGPGRPRKVKTI